MAAICFVYKNLVSFTICIPCTPNTPRIFYKSCSWCSIFRCVCVCVCVYILLFMQSPILSLPPTFPGAVTLLNIGIRVNYSVLHPKALPPPWYHRKSKIWPKGPLHWCPPLPSLYPCYWFSSQWIHSMQRNEYLVNAIWKKAKTSDPWVCTMYKVSMGLEATISCFPGCKNSYLSQFQAAKTTTFNSELGEAVL